MKYWGHLKHGRLEHGVSNVTQPKSTDIISGSGYDKKAWLAKLKSVYCGVKLCINTILTYSQQKVAWQWLAEHLKRSQSIYMHGFDSNLEL